MHTLTTKDRESLTPTYPHLQPMVMSSPVTIDPMAASKDRWQRQQRFVDRAYNRMPTVSLPPVPTVGSYRITHLTVRGETPVDHPMDAVWASARFNMRLRAMRRNPDNTVTLDPWFKRSIVIPARTTLTHKQRAAIRVMLDTIQRETITWEERQELDNHVAAITTSYGFKGLTPSPEVRVRPSDRLEEVSCDASDREGERNRNRFEGPVRCLGVAYVGPAHVHVPLRQALHRVGELHRRGVMVPQQAAPPEGREDIGQFAHRECVVPGQVDLVHRPRQLGEIVRAALQRRRPGPVTGAVGVDGAKLLAVDG